jgi:hypothetical protein
MGFLVKTKAHSNTQLLPLLFAFRKTIQEVETTTMRLLCILFHSLSLLHSKQICCQSSSATAIHSFSYESAGFFLTITPMNLRTMPTDAV